jgi:SAM-dependent methyltransferase
MLVDSRWYGVCVELLPKMFSLRKILGLKQAPRKISPDAPAPLQTVRIASMAEFQAFSRLETSHALTPEIPAGIDENGRFVVPGFCWVDQREVSFSVDFLYGTRSEGRLVPNWRERLLCPFCHFNNRQRAAIHLFEIHCRPESKAAVYITEQVSPVYRWLAAHYPNLVGSEFLGGEFSPGEVNRAGTRHEDLTRLSFRDQTMDAVLSFDVFEHIPDFLAAFRECARILKPGGMLLTTVPFRTDNPMNLIRARHGEAGELIHDEPPEYHGDPVNPDQGVLCYQHFGWEMLDHLRSCGFAESYALVLQSAEFGYLGGYQLAFVAKK